MRLSARDRLAVALASADATRRGALGRLYASPLYRWRYRGAEPERLASAPQDLRTADPTRAREIIDGRFTFAGKSVDCAKVSPFLIEPPSGAWREALLGFHWLRHLRALDGAASRQTARRLVAEFIRSPAALAPEGLDPVIAARRVLSLLAQSPLVLDGADRGFYRAFLRNLAWQARYLIAAGPAAEDGMPRLLAAIAAAQAGLSLSDAGSLRRRALAALAAELGRQVLPDGGHVSRNPGAVIDLLLDLLPLRQSFSARNVVPPPAILNAIDRLMPMLRFFRHADGAIAAFNGMGYTQTHLVATLSSYDDTRGRPMQNAPHSGYQRVDAGGGVLVVDSGRAPPVAVSREAHAGALSFEFSHGGQRIIINCGAPGPGRESWRQPARATAAHSTASVGERSSAIFAADGGDPRRGRPIIAGPSRVTVARSEAEGRVVLDLAHDGYQRSFNLIHERRLSLDQDSGALAGRDRFVTAAGAPWRGRQPVLLRFHLHPQVTVLGLAEDGLLIGLATGRRWRFRVVGARPELDESVHFANPEGPRRTRQVVLTLAPGSDGGEAIDWTLDPLR
jgi:uncharacterized heparinase superfamily protein